MKRVFIRIISLTVAAIFAVSCLAFAGCSKVDGELEKEMSDALVATFSYQIGDHISSSEYKSVSSDELQNFSTERTVDTVTGKGYYSKMIRRDKSGNLTSDMDTWVVTSNGKYFTLISNLKDGEYYKTGNEITKDEFDGNFMSDKDIASSEADIAAMKKAGFSEVLRSICGVNPDKEGDYEYDIKKQGDTLILTAEYDATADKVLYHYDFEIRISYPDENTVKYSGTQNATRPDDKNFYLTKTSDVTVTKNAAEFTHTPTEQEISSFLPAEK